LRYIKKSFSHELKLFWVFKAGVLCPLCSFLPVQVGTVRAYFTLVTHLMNVRSHISEDALPPNTGLSCIKTTFIPFLAAAMAAHIPLMPPPIMQNSVSSFTSRIITPPHRFQTIRFPTVLNLGFAPGIHL
jgi:hypothetical protein